jgi:hypothetical protein
MLTLNSAPTGFNCVHLPIVYEYSSNLFPTNSADTVRTVSSFSDDNGYCRLTLSGDIKATGSANELEFVKVVVDGVADVYQIYNYYSDTDITIDLGYNAGFVFGNVQYYYSNYHGRFKIYAGLRTGHTYNSSKPTRLITEVRAVPDSSGVIKLNINEILKSDIGILTEGTNENDITQFTEFYVDFAESYDQSLDGYTLVSFVSSYTDDSANYAIATNSKLPFKNGNGGEMTVYSVPVLKFLTLFTEPVMFPGNPFKMYYLDDVGYSLFFRQYNESGVIQNDEINYIQDEGVYQNEDLEAYLNPNATYAEVFLNDSQSEVLTIRIDRECSNQSIYLRWRNYLGGMDHWLFTAEKEYTIDIEGVEQTEDNIFIDWPNSYNADKIKYDIKRDARESILVRSQNLTLAQLNAIKYIKTSPYVVSDRVVLVDNQSFTVYSEADKLYSISFKITFTDLIPSQSL